MSATLSLVRAFYALALLVGILAAAPSSASAASPRSCGVVRGWKVSVDPQTTTCNLARSATRDFVRKLGRDRAVPVHIVGTSTKTSQSYRFTRVRTLLTRANDELRIYTGHAGDAILTVRISVHLY